MIDGNGNRAGLFYDGHGRQSCWMFPSTTRPASLQRLDPGDGAGQRGRARRQLANGQCSTGDFESYGYDAARQPADPEEARRGHA